MKLAQTFLLTLIFATNGFISSAQTLQTLVSFNGTNGAYPYAALTLGTDGNFYGTTESGSGNNYYGTVFKVTTNGVLTTLVSFSNTNGAYPYAPLTLGADGNFYGTTLEGGSSYYGTVFKVTTNGVLTTLVSFNGTNGADLYAGLTLGPDGNFYGTTKQGISSSYWGTAFKVTTNGILTTLVSFNFSPGAYPLAGLTLGNDGNFYGTTEQSITEQGGSSYGTVFMVTTNGIFTNLVSFNFSNGSDPKAALTLGPDNNFYGTTYYGGSGYGTVFKVTTNGTLKSLASFNYSNGMNPTAALLLGPDGNFYGTTFYAGIRGGSSFGTVFQVTTNGALTALISFSSTNGAEPYAGLTSGPDGNFYGTTYYGGITNSVYPHGMGTIYRLVLSPVINVQPQIVTSNAGVTVTFLVNATGLKPMVYQWQKNGTNLVNGGNISGATTNTLNITNISDNDAAGYSVIITNFFGTVTSSNATLIVIDPPTLALQFSGGYPQLNLVGILSNNFVVQYSTNLGSTNWITLLSLTNLPSSPYEFHDPAGIVPPARFYRTFMQ
jgi:uncharacterized repeat protein (TIGR03803 family)